MAANTSGRPIALSIFDRSMSAYPVPCVTFAITKSQGTLDRSMPCCQFEMSIPLSAIAASFHPDTRDIVG